MSDKVARAQFEHTRAAGGCRIRVNGVIDESFDKERFVGGVEGVVVVDLDEVTRITSYGVREWMSALHQLKHTWLGFVNCRPAMVSQFNMVAGFAGRGHVLSLYLPYSCPTSGQSFEVRVDLRKAWAELAAFRPPPAQCPDSGTQAEFDDVPEAYLSFVASQPAPDPPPLVDRLLTDAGEPTGSLRVRKDVLGDVTGLWLSGRLDAKDHFKRLADGLEGTLFVSCGDLSFGAEEGIARLLKFLRSVTVPLVMGDLPLGLADRIAADPVLLKSVIAVTLVLPAVCEEHGTVTQSVEATKLTEAFAGTPLLLFCPHCARICSRAFVVKELANLAALKTAPMPDAVRAVVTAHDKSLVEITKTVPGMGGPEASPVMERYQIVRPLGAGGMAEVYLARQVGDGGFERAVVLKRILPGLATDSGFVEMFLQEARLASRISHPNVVQIFDVGRDSGQYFMVMELVSGWDLNTILRAAIKAKRPFPVQLAARITADVARGLSAAHAYSDDAGRLTPIIHRDVSPHNVLVSTQGHVKLTDFGIAKAADSLTHTPTSFLKGKAAYMAPELVKDARTPPDPRMDLFAAGLVFYQLVTLTHPFRRESEMATFQALMNEHPAVPSSLVPGLLPAVDLICQRALAKRPAERYQTAHQLEHDLELVITMNKRPVTASDVATFITGIPGLMPLGEAPEGPSVTKKLR